MLPRTGTCHSWLNKWPGISAAKLVLWGTTLALTVIYDCHLTVNLVHETKEKSRAVLGGAVVMGESEKLGVCGFQGLALGLPLAAWGAGGAFRPRGRSRHFLRSQGGPRAWDDLAGSRPPVLRVLTSRLRAPLKMRSGLTRPRSWCSGPGLLRKRFQGSVGAPSRKQTWRRPHTGS